MLDRGQLPWPPVRKAFATNLLLLLGVNVLVKPAYLLGIDLGVQNTVGTEAYGRLAYWTSFVFLFGTLLDLGLHNYNAVTMARQPELLRQRLPFTLSLKLVLTLIYGAVVLGVAWSFGTSPDDLTLILWLILSQIALSTWQLLRGNVAAQGKYQFNSLLSVADKFILLIVLGGMLLLPAWTPWITVERFVMMQVAALLAGIGITVWGTDLEPGQRWLEWKWSEIRTLLRGTFPFALTLLLSSLAVRVDMLMLERMSVDGLYQTGLYAGGYRLLDGLNMVSFLFATLLLPMLSSMAEKNEPVRPLLQQGTQYMLILTLGVATWGTFYAGEVCQLLYREATPAWGPVLAVLLWASVGTGLMYIHGSFLLAIKRLRAINLIFLLASLLNILLNLYLIPLYGAFGAGLATAFTQAIIALVAWILAHRATRSEPDAPAEFGLVWRIAIFTMSTLLVAFLSQRGGLGLLMGTLVQALSGMALAFFLGFFPPVTDLRAYLRRISP